jgi:ribosomal protein S18 acetylase RimI-like enzyme
VTAFPAGWTTRRPTLDDVPAILTMVHASDIAATGAPDFTADEVREALTVANTNPEEDCWLALDDTGAIVGWAYPDNPSAGDREFIEVYVDPQRGRPALAPLLDLLLARVAVRAAIFGHDPMTVRAGAVPTEQAWIDTLTAAGFVFLKQHARMTMSLAGVATDVPEPPDAVTIRPVRADDDAEMRRFHAIIDEAFADTDHLATDYRAWRDRLATSTSVSFDEWFVAEIDGEWAGVLESSDQAVEDSEGWVKALAVRRPYRRRGVGEALLRRAFAAYAQKGRASAGLGVDLENPTEAARLYRSVGMTPAYEANIYQRTVSAARLPV